MAKLQTKMGYRGLVSGGSRLLKVSGPRDGFPGHNLGQGNPPYPIKKYVGLVKHRRLRGAK